MQILGAEVRKLGSQSSEDVACFGVSPYDYEQEAIKRLDGKEIDTYMDNSKNKGSQETLQPLDF